MRGPDVGGGVLDQSGLAVGLTRDPNLVRRSDATKVAHGAVYREAYPHVDRIIRHDQRGERPLPVYPTYSTSDEESTRSPNVAMLYSGGNLGARATEAQRAPNHLARAAIGV